MKMKRIIPMLFALALTLSPATAQTLMREVFAAAPDSIFPLLTRNNRLDCIDFIENNMPARVKNRFDGVVELTSLTPDFLQLQTSARSQVQMKLFATAQGDSLLCFVRTLLGPVADSEVRFFDLHWRPAPRPQSLRPQVKAFVQESMEPDALALLEALPLMRATLSPDEPTLRWDLQHGELAKAQKKAAEQSLQPIIISLAD